MHGYAIVSEVAKRIGSNVFHKFPESKKFSLCVCVLARPAPCLMLHDKGLRKNCSDVTLNFCTDGCESVLVVTYSRLCAIRLATRRLCSLRTINIWVLVKSIRAETNHYCRINAAETLASHKKKRNFGGSNLRLKLLPAFLAGPLSGDRSKW